MLFNSIPTYLLTEMKGPLLAEFTLQCQSQSKKKTAFHTKTGRDAPAPS